MKKRLFQPFMAMNVQRIVVGMRQVMSGLKRKE